MQSNPVVILTQEEGDNQALGRLLSNEGIGFISYPCMETVLIPFSESMLPTGTALDSFKLVAFTSKRAVAAMEGWARKLEHAGPALACVGRGTARAVVEILGMDVTLIPELETGEELGKLILRTYRDPVPVLHPRGELTTGAMQKVLAANGWDVCEIVVYKSKEPDLAELGVEDEALAVFASPSAANRFFTANQQLLEAAICISIGPATTRCLEQLGASMIVQAASASREGLARAVITTISKGVADG